MRTVVVVPTYNEAENVEEFVRRLGEAAPDLELLIVDDASPDGTADLAEKVFAGRPGYRVYRRTGPRGLGRSYIDAFQRVIGEGYDRVVQMDADLSHDPKYLPALTAATERADLAIGSRYCRGGGVRDWPARRILLSRWANLYVRAITGVPVNDATAGFRCWTRAGLEAVDLPTVASEGYSFQVEMTWRAHKAGLRIVEVPIVFTDRRYGQSKMSGHVIWESAKTPWRLRRQGGPSRRSEGA